MKHLAPSLGSYKGHATDKLVLFNAACHAHPPGCGITVGKYTGAKETGCSDHTVNDAMARLRKAGVLERTAERTAARGGDVHRLVCQRCYHDTAAEECQRCRTPPAGGKGQRC
jgi:hypothetical protein